MDFRGEIYELRISKDIKNQKECLPILLDIKTLKTILTTILFFCFITICIGQNSINCLPDKGIKTAKTFAKLEAESIGNPYKIHYREIMYDLSGRPVLIRDSRDGTEHMREYKNGKLHSIISSRKMLPDFYSIEKLYSLIQTASAVIDTAFVARYHSDGELAELKHPNGDYQLFEYNGCNKELHTFLSNKSDTIHQYQTTFKNGVVIKTIWTPFLPVKSKVITDYYDYEFNKYGHWTKRKYKHIKGEVIEWRKLTYH
ncbi:hypothetical protein [Flagellimonas myxillae]|uniref:hypothetical protein n=1 Tax=Flagellimonas myxillae TaxID=2942214 RepID=UPI00201F629F|nr:hypothetical protein [Muricauda myxillae]MCL6266425.1 hypothetical protein [Muricauda myxillae]